MTVIKRIQAPTPTFFKKVRNIALVLAAISGSILAAPVALPAVVVQVAGYLAVAAGVASAVSQVTTTDEEPAEKGGRDGN
jgi:hypothetical protein